MILGICRQHLLSAVGCSVKLAFTGVDASGSGYCVDVVSGRSDGSGGWVAQT